MNSTIKVIGWKLVNPHSIVSDFDDWFEFEWQRASHDDGWIPDLWLREFYGAMRR